MALKLVLPKNFAKKVHILVFILALVMRSLCMIFEEEEEDWIEQDWLEDEYE